MNTPEFPQCWGPNLPRSEGDGQVGLMPTRYPGCVGPVADWGVVFVGHVDRA